MTVSYKFYECKREIIYVIWERKNTVVCFKNNQLMADFVQRSDELQLVSEKSCEDIENNGMKILTIQCESIAAESLLKLKPMIASNLFKMKVYGCQQKVSEKLSDTKTTVGKISSK